MHYQLLFFSVEDAASTEIYTLSLHDALPIYGRIVTHGGNAEGIFAQSIGGGGGDGSGALASGSGELAAKLEIGGDRKSTRLNSSHVKISYAVFCLKKKKNKIIKKTIEK